MNEYRKKSLIKRFFEKVKFGSAPNQRPDLGRCWIWTGTHHTRNGKPWYGLFWVNGSNPGAHRVSWEIHWGRIPDGKLVCRKCDIPLCVNPDHLFLGSQADNIADAVKKGRMRKGPLPPECYTRGSEIPWAKLKESDVIKAKKLYRQGMKPRHIASKLRMTIGSVRRIVYEQAWRHIKLD